MGEPFTLRIFVPDGNPESVRIFDRMNWTGKGVAFPRDKWRETKTRDSFKKPGVYILVGHIDADDDLPTLYIGQSDELHRRIESHYQNKDFWNWGVVFVSTSGSGLNRAHITWLEYALIERAQKANRCRMNNNATPSEPTLSESEKADTRAFFREILQILPLAGLRALEIPRPVVASEQSDLDVKRPKAGIRTDDTIIVPARREGFDQVFIGENAWYAIRIAGGKLPKIKYIAAYQGSPISAITHYAPVERIEPYGENGKYKLFFAEPAKLLKRPIPFADARAGSMQSPRYTTLTKLMEAEKVADIFG